MKDPAKFWDEAAEKYAKSPIDDMDGYSRTLDMTRKHLSKTDKVLEIGCGTGSTALLLAESVTHIVASDISPNMIEIGRSKAKDGNISNVEFIVADVLAVNPDTGPYDAVLAFNILHLLEDLPSVIERVHEMLKPEGLFISKTICQFGPKMPLKYKLIKAVLPLMQMIGKAPFVKFRSENVLEDMIASPGFEIVETGDYPTRYIVARKLA